MPLTTSLTLSPRPSKTSLNSVAELHQDLSQQGHLNVPEGLQLMEESKSIAALVRTRLALRGERTIALLDPHGLSTSDEVSGVLSAHGPTTLISVMNESSLRCSDSVVKHVAVQGGVNALFQHIQRTPLLAGTVDMVVGYHSGIDAKRESIRLANHLLTPQGCYLEYFIPPDSNGFGRVVTYYTRDEVVEIATAHRSNFDRVIAGLRAKAQGLLDSTRARLLGVNLFSKKEIPS